MDAPCTAAARTGSRSFEEFRAGGYLPALDGLRAIAILLVLFHHVFRHPTDWLHALHENGRYGVDLFFVLSGFLICTLLLREESETGRISLKSFYLRRAARLMPLYYLVLAFQCIVIAGTSLYSPEGTRIFWEKLPAYVFYYSNLLTNATEGPFFFAWSLAAEEQFYLWFGCAMVFLPRKVLPAFILGMLILKLALQPSFGPLPTQSVLVRSLFSYQEGLLCGVLLGFALNVPRIYQAVAACLGSPWILGGLGLLGAVWIVTHQLIPDELPILVLLMTLITGGVVVRRRLPFLDTTLVAHIGRVSYGVYLLHWFVLTALDRVIPRGWPTSLFLAGAIISIGLASLTYRYLESPIIASFRRAKPGRPGIPPAGPATGSVPIAPLRRPRFIVPRFGA